VVNKLRCVWLRLVKHKMFAYEAVEPAVKELEKIC